MKEKNSRKDAIKELLKKYKFDRPLPDDRKKQLGRIRKKSMIAILEKKGKYSSFLFLAVTFFFWVKRFGISLSLGKSAVAVLTAMIVILGAVATSAYYAVSGLLMKHEITSEQAMTSPTKDPGRPLEPPREEKTSYRIVVGNFDFDPELAAAGRQTNSSIRSELLRIKGGTMVAMAGAPGSAKTNMILAGSIIRLDATFLITAKIIDRTTSRVLFLVSESAESEQDIPRACRVISEKIAGRI
jgi:hypothetical protein